jgi:hypothetical protein
MRRARICEKLVTTEDYARRLSFSELLLLVLLMSFYPQLFTWCAGEAGARWSNKVGKRGMGREKEGARRIERSEDALASGGCAEVIKLAQTI